MVQGPSADLIDAIRRPASLEAQIAHLKQLKNEINGHDQRKEVAVKKGVVQPLVDILTAPVKAAGKRTVNGAQQPSPQSSWTPEYEARLHATLLLATLAAGGPAFVHPLLAAGAGTALVHATEEEDPAKLVTATLRALRNLAASAVLANQTILGLPMPSNTGVLESLLKRGLTSSAVAGQQQKLAAELVAFLANDENMRQPLAEALLDTLASLLVSNTIANDYFEYYDSTSDLPPAPSNATVPYILSAVAAIVQGSKFRTQSFILSPSIRNFFSRLWLDGVDTRPLFGSARNANSNPFEHLLPQLQVSINKTVSFTASSAAFPALSSLQGGEGKTTGNASDLSNLRPGYDGAIANPVFKWLIFLARSMRGYARLVALKVTALVNEAADADAQLVTYRSECLRRQRERECYMAQLAVPLAVQLVHDSMDGKSSDPFPSLEKDELKVVKEEVCNVLAMVIQPTQPLQDSAVAAGAIKRVCAFLKQTLDAVNIAKPMWSAHPPSTTSNDAPESCKMGPPGLPLEVRHVLRCRQSALEAIAALAKSEDLHRKSLVDAGILTCVIDCLKPLAPEFSTIAGSGRPPHNFTPKDGNTIEVIIAACHAAQSVSRSVAMLRTSLIDSGIVKPTFELVTHSELAVRIAATDVCINLALEFSPMREGLVGLGAVKTLTEHARQSDMQLRISSLWALKHLVLNISRDIKMQCLEELGPGWLVGAVQGEQDTSSAAADLASISTGGVSVSVGTGGLSTPNAAGEQVNILNPSTTSMDVDEQAEDDEPIDEDDDEDGEILYDEAAGTHYQSSQLRSTLHRLRDTDSAPSGISISRYLRAVRENEENPILQAKRDDIAVQEQAIDFIRNMLHGPEDCAFMVEHLCRTIGQNKLFSLLSDKLAPVSGTQNFSDLVHGRSSPKVVYQPTELILTTVHAITHIANGSPTQKQLLIAQKQLLLNWLPHFNHHDRRVRVMCLWAVNALTWADDDNDRLNATQRVRELRLVGIESAIKGLVNDADLDVRERVKTAIRQMDSL